LLQIITIIALRPDYLRGTHEECRCEIGYSEKDVGAAMLYRLVGKLIVVWVIVGSFESANSQEILKAHPSQCLITRSNISALNGNSVIELLSKEILAQNGTTVTLVVDVTGAAIKSASKAKAVSAKIMQTLCANLAALDHTVLSTSPNFQIKLKNTPNDPQYSSLYAMNKINAPAAWEITTGSSDVVVGVIDTGIDYTHPDLQENIWTNSGEIAGNNIDDDNNGYVDDVHGYDFHNNDGNPYDDNGHGTHVAGTIGGRGNNGVGVVGVNWNVKMMALKFLSASGSGYLSNAIRGIYYATQNGAVITNNSWGGGGFSQTMYDAIADAANNNVLFVAASGNSGVNADINPMYPAAYNVSNIVSVAATDHNNQLTYFSNYGATSVDLAAPGYQIISTYPGGGYAALSGTSMASPHVAGAAALVKAAHPEYTMTQLQDSLLGNIEPLASLNGYMTTGGILNVYASVLNGAVAGNNFSLDLNYTSTHSNQKATFYPQSTLLTLTGEISSANVKIKAGKLTCQIYNGSVFNNQLDIDLTSITSKLSKAFKTFSFIAVSAGKIRTLNALISRTSAQKSAFISPFYKNTRFNKLCKKLNGQRL